MKTYSVQTTVTTTTLETVVADNEEAAIASTEGVPSVKPSKQVTVNKSAVEVTAS